MIDEPPTNRLQGPVLLCAGTDPAVAARLADAAAALLADRPAVVLATWEPPRLAGIETLADALYDAREDLRAASRRAAAETAHAAAEVLDAHGLHVTRQVCPEEGSAWQIILDAADAAGAAVIVAGTSERSHADPAALGRVARALAHRSRRPLLLSARLQAVGRASEGAATLTGAGWQTEVAAPAAVRNAPAALVDAADERDAAILVSVTRGRSRVAAAVLGSAAEAILRHAARPVLLVPPPAN